MNDVFLAVDASVDIPGMEVHGLRYGVPARLTRERARAAGWALRLRSKALRIHEGGEVIPTNSVIELPGRLAVHRPR